MMNKLQYSTELEQCHVILQRKVKKPIFHDKKFQKEQFDIFQIQLNQGCRTQKHANRDSKQF